RFWRRKEPTANQSVLPRFHRSTQRTCSSTWKDILWFPADWNTSLVLGRAANKPVSLISATGGPTTEPRKKLPLRRPLTGYSPAGKTTRGCTSIITRPTNAARLGA